MTILITNARIVDPATGADEVSSILFDETILKIGAKASSDAQIIDAGGKAVLPGLVDMRVVLGEPGAEHKETIKSAGRAAAAGGVTTFVVMPNTDPVIDDQSLVHFIRQRGEAVTGVNVLPAAALTKALDGEHMTEMALLRETGAVMFSNGDSTIADSRVLRRALSYSTAFNILVAHRPEDPFLARGGAMHEGALAARLGIPGIPAAAEVITATRDLELAALTGARLLLDMISSAATLGPLARAKEAGVKAYASVSVHHLSLNEFDVDEYRTFAKLSPPLRSEEDRKALVQALADGLIDVVVSGHDPRPAEEKRIPFDEASPGASALETLLPALIGLYHCEALTLLDIARAASYRPAQLLGLDCGRLTPGAPADLILVDLDKPFKLDSEKFLSKCKNSPFDEKPMQGRVERTFVAGRQVFPAP